MVIVTFESRREVPSCLESLNSTAPDWVREVIVVDNASSDGTSQFLRSNHKPNILVQINSENIGFGRAMNQGAASATGEYLLILNPDCTMQPGTVAELAHFLDCRPEAAACGPMICGTKGEFQYCSRRGFPTPLNAVAYIFHLDRLFPRNRTFGGYQMRFLDPRLELVTDSLSGACMMVRRSVFQEVGGFDEDYFLFGEDIDLCWKIRQAGHEVWYTPRAQVRHVKGASMRSAPGRAQREFYHSMRLFVDKRLSSRYSPPSLALIKSGIGLVAWWARARS